jgi:hypothetical protein
MGCVYVMEYGPRDSKVGISVEPALRFRALRAAGAGRLHRQWVRPADARAVEAMAHRLLRDFRVRVSGQRERFHVSADAAARAVELAIVLVGEAVAEEVARAAVREAAIAALGEVAPLPPLAAHGQHVGYVRAPTAREASAECDVLTRAGVDVARIHVDVGKLGAGFRAARRALVDQPGVLVTVGPGRLDDASLAKLAADGLEVVALQALARMPPHPGVDAAVALR